MKKEHTFLRACAQHLQKSKLTGGGAQSGVRAQHGDSQAAVQPMDRGGLQAKTLVSFTLIEASLKGACAGLGAVMPCETFGKTSSV